MRVFIREDCQCHCVFWQRHSRERGSAGVLSSFDTMNEGDTGCSLFDDQHSGFKSKGLASIDPVLTPFVFFVSFVVRMQDDIHPVSTSVIASVFFTDPAYAMLSATVLF